MQDPFAQYAVKDDPFAAYAAKAPEISMPSAEDMLMRRVGADFSETPAKPDWKTPLNDALSAMAHPKSISDIGNYFIPAALPATVGRLVSPVARGVAKYGGAAMEVGKSLLPEKAQAAIRVLGELKPSEWHSPLTVGGRDARAAEAARAFNEAPITKQMDQLPQTPAPEPGRISGPPPRRETPFNERPLQEQMKHLPPTPAPETTRAGAPIGQQGTINDLPLVRQMAHLPTTDAPLLQGTLRMRASGPPPRVETPFHEQPLYQQMEQLPATPAPTGARVGTPQPANLGRETQPVPAAAPPPATASAGTSPGVLSPTDRASLQKQGYPPELIARIEQRLTQGEVVRSTPSRDVSPLREPRINIGAQRVGRQEGLSKEAVRQTTGPVLDEGLGEASPIFPKAALARIVDDMRALPPGAEREAYVARATSGKAKWQVENIRRTLEHLGLLLPLAVRARIMQQQMRGDASSAGQ